MLDRALGVVADRDIRFGGAAHEFAGKSLTGSGQWRISFNKSAGMIGLDSTGTFSGSSYFSASIEAG